MMRGCVPSHRRHECHRHTRLSRQLGHTVYEWPSSSTNALPTMTATECHEGGSVRRVRTAAFLSPIRHNWQLHDILLEAGAASHMAQRRQHGKAAAECTSHGFSLDDAYIPNATSTISVTTVGVAASCWHRAWSLRSTLQDASSHVISSCSAIYNAASISGFPTGPTMAQRFIKCSKNFTIVFARHISPRQRERIVRQELAAILMKSYHDTF